MTDQQKTCCQSECSRKLNRVLLKESERGSDWVSLGDLDIKDQLELELCKVLSDLIGAKIWLKGKTADSGW